jgi:hypothetical protein
MNDISGLICGTRFQNFISQIKNAEAFFTDVVRALGDMPYAVIGSLARKCYIDHREATKDIDFLILYPHRKDLRSALSNIAHDALVRPHSSLINISRNNCALTMDFLIATEGFDPEDSCVNDAARLDFHGLSVRVAKPEYLVWLLTRSPHERHKQDMGHLLQSGKVDVNRLLAWLEYSRETEEISIVKKFVAQAKQ